MENHLQLPNELCDRIFTQEFEVDMGNVSE